MANLFQRVLDKLTGRAISDASWDGAASNYESTEAYCSACLIDVNSAAGSSEKVQANCKLPVKEPNGDINRNAVHAAAAALAGGRGGITKPQDVSADAWDRAVTAAAKKVITMYKEMDETAPESIYDLAGKKAPEERALDMGRLYYLIHEAMKEAMGGPMTGMMGGSTEYAYPIDLYHEGQAMFLILANEGKLYRMEVTVGQDDTVALGQPVEVTQAFMPAGGQERSRITVIRQAQGPARFLLIAATAVLNRVGEVDSMALFDSFVRHAAERGYPYLTFWHKGEALKLGQADYLARDGAVYMASGLFEDTPAGMAAAAGLEADPEYWGTSIGYWPLVEPELYEVARGINIPVYTDGWNEELSLLPETQAASWFTVVRAKDGKARMNAQQKEALVKLVGPTLADEFETRVDTTNRAIDDGKKEGLIVRDAQPTGEGQAEATAQEPAKQPATETPAAQVEKPVTQTPQEFIMDEGMINALAQAVMNSPALKAMATAMGALQEALATVAQNTNQLQAASVANTRAVGELKTQVASLSKTDEDKKREWLADAPQTRQTVITFRPREARAPQGTEDGKANLASVADSTLANFKGPKPGSVK